MPRYDDGDPYGRETTRLYVGHLSSRSHSRDLDDLFGRYGRVQVVDMKHDFAFIDRIVVEFAKETPRGSGGSREYLGRGPGRCFNRGLDGHWKAGDRKNKRYRCGERGHIERNCQNSPKNLERGREGNKIRDRLQELSAKNKIEDIKMVFSNLLWNCRLEWKSMINKW
ncbi:hypothetical protein MKW92_000855 [Papaver armeniacum]|nr:hypothetical protein MKW92_000855 [Papaver armeniacum]